MSQADFGRLVHYSDSMVSAFELGQRPLDRLLLLRADEVLETGGLLVHLYEEAERSREPAWWRTWREAEEAAEQLRCWVPHLIPGLLQTERYARAILRLDCALSDAEVERLVAGRMERQKILTQENPVQYVAVLDEAMLRRTDEEFAGIMTEQLQHLLACAERPNVTILAIPASVTLHIGLSGPFVLARSAEGEWIGHLESQLGGELVRGEAGLASLLRRWEYVRNDALPWRQSLDLIKEVANSWT
ncbi:DUF5753 domain-containing protein [Micromonospora zhanjiangensis]|uniref:DUF5753 domain-containing protein n=1 Tax=Micromonospora zhanjiangensis TaxID=1522057 RepID=A0ABV8KNX2_9ACTN